MSIKALVEGIEQARVNNRELGVSVAGKLNDLISRLNGLVIEIEDTKRGFAAEIEERDRDLVRLMEGAA